jgi:hypothetical protein
MLKVKATNLQRCRQLIKEYGCHAGQPVQLMIDNTTYNCIVTRGVGIRKANGLEGYLFRPEAQINDPLNLIH